ncbi:nucleotidyltransferase domain-containing protein [Candidatus Woesearchaeota archaeon]|nr:nucleotidyltransferase domain-containing protein [Candidatus Woesearchaeota archaeon]
MLKELLTKDRNARRVFGRREIEIIIKQLEGRTLTQSERNRLSRDIKPKLEFITNASRFEGEFKLRKNQENEEIIKKAAEAVLQDELGSEARAILLFGSFADGTFTPRSDIDICVVLRRDISLKEATQFRIRVSGQLPEKADIQVFNTLPEKVKREIAKNHKIVYKAADYDNINFTATHLKDQGYFIRLREIFGAKA